MWRGAEGLLWAIVLLAGGLSSCAGAPAPALAPPRLSVVPPEERLEPEYPCGGSHDVERRSPEQRRAELARRIEGGARHFCQPYAVAQERHGEVRVAVAREQEISTDAGPGTTESDRLCIEKVVQTALEAERRDDEGRFPGDFEIYVALGTQPPLFPTRKQLTQWQAAMRSKPARQRFIARLPAEVLLTDEDCLSMPDRPAFRQALENWIAKIGAPVDEPPQGSKADPDRRAWRVGRAVLVRRGLETDDSRQEICLSERVDLPGPDSID